VTRWGSILELWAMAVCPLGGGGVVVALFILLSLFLLSLFLSSLFTILLSFLSYSSHLSLTPTLHSLSHSLSFSFNSSLPKEHTQPLLTPHSSI
jgi:hypothetical protein